MKYEYNDATRYLNEFPEFVNKVRDSAYVLQNSPMISIVDKTTGAQRLISYLKVEQKYFVVDEFGSNIKVYSGDDVLSNRRPTEVANIMQLIENLPQIKYLPLPLVLEFNSAYKNHYNEDEICGFLTSNRIVKSDDIEKLKSENKMVEDLISPHHENGNPSLLFREYEQKLSDYFKNRLFITDTSHLLDYMKAVDSVIESKNYSKELGFANKGYDLNFLKKCNEHMAAYFDSMTGDLVDNVDEMFNAVKKLPNNLLSNEIWLEKDGNRLIIISEASMVVVDRNEGKGNYEFYLRDFGSIAKFTSDIDSGNINELAENVFSVKDNLAIQVQESSFNFMNLIIKEGIDKLDDKQVVVNTERNNKLN